MLVRECLHKGPVTVPPQCSIKEAAQLMATEDIGALLVTSGSELRGIVTDRDIAVQGVGTGQSSTTPVGALMAECPVTIQGSADIFEVFDTFHRTQVRRLPVLEDDQVAGIITADDLLVAIASALVAVVAPIARDVDLPRTPTA